MRKADRQKKLYSIAKSTGTPSL
eukprot:COSAG02_NODE_33628_length_497_cov_0.909548_1_plen_22_part_10